MQIYLVGGAVRDALMGLPVVDRDWVVVGSTPAEMVAQGFKPVGKDFPVFLHPVTHEEYALARTERKTVPGYRGFVIHAAPDVTLEQDLARRDITINSIAVYAQHTRPERLIDSNVHQFSPNPSQLIDPFGGQADVQAKLLRHVTPAFREDPVRILRVARFNARFPDFSVAPETLALMRDMVASGEVNALVAERVWQELSKGLMAARPSKMMAVLADTDALRHLLPPLRTHADTAFAALDKAAEAGASLAVRFTCLMSHFEPDAAFLRRVPRQCSELAALWEREHAAIAIAATGAPELVRLFERCDAFRKPARFGDLLHCCALPQGRDTQGTETRRLAGALAVARTVTSQTALAQFAAQERGGADASGLQVAAAIRQARVAAVSGYLASGSTSHQ